jgi:hypothetical protein
MYVLEFLCFFNKISDYYQAYDKIFLEFSCVCKKDFILYKSVKCKNNLIEVKGGNVLFGFHFEVNNYFPKKRSNEKVDEIAQKVRNLNFFIDEGMNNYICFIQDLDNQLNNLYELENARYFSNQPELIQYSFKHKLFSIDSIPDKIKGNIEEILAYSKGVIKALKRFHN